MRGFQSGRFHTQGLFHLAAWNATCRYVCDGVFGCRPLCVHPKEPRGFFGQYLDTSIPPGHTSGSDTAGKQMKKKKKHTRPVKESVYQLVAPWLENGMRIVQITCTYCYLALPQPNCYATHLHTCTQAPTYAWTCASAETVKMKPAHFRSKSHTRSTIYVQRPWSLSAQLFLCSSLALQCYSQSCAGGFFWGGVGVNACRRWEFSVPHGQP